MTFDLATGGFTAHTYFPGAIITVKPRLTVDRIQRVVAAHYGLATGDMTSQRRSRDIAHPRQIAMYLAFHLTPHSLCNIGRFFGKRDHTTVLYAVRKIEGLCISDPDFGATVDLLRERIAG